MAPDPDMRPDKGAPAEDRAPCRWQALAANAAEPNAFYAPELLRPALAHLDPGQEVRLIEALAGGECIGLMPVRIARRHGRLPVRNVMNWMHPHCFLGAPLLRAGQEQAAWRSFLAQLDAAPWAPNFLHLAGIEAGGANAAALKAVCAADRRALAEVHRYDRALLRSPLSADAYWTANMRAKKRKEIRRLQKRLAEMGRVESRELADAADLPRWCGDFLTLEAGGWKGAGGTALASTPADAAFFRDAIAAAFAAGTLIFLRIDLDGRPIAMLVNFRHGRGSFSFKIAFDEALARFSPGVLVEIDNLHRVQGSETIDWMDSCAAPGHPMIDSLWAERRSIVQYRIALKGRRRAAVLAAVNAAEAAMKRLKGLAPA